MFYYKVVENHQLYINKIKNHNQKKIFFYVKPKSWALTHEKILDEKKQSFLNFDLWFYVYITHHYKQLCSRTFFMKLYSSWDNSNISKKSKLLNNSWGLNFRLKYAITKL